PGPCSPASAWSSPSSPSSRDALELGELGEDQAEAGEHGPGHERGGQAGPHPGRPVVQVPGRAEPGGQRAPGQAGDGGRTAAGVVEERQDLVSVAGPPGGRVEGEGGPGQRRPHAPAQPRRVLSRSLATEATLLIRSDCWASASAPAIVMRYGRRRSSDSSGSISPRASSRAITA